MQPIVLQLSAGIDVVKTVSTFTCRHQLPICIRAAPTLLSISPPNFSHLFVFFFFHGRLCLQLLPPTLHLRSQQHRRYCQCHHTPSSSSSSSPMTVCLGPPPTTLHLHPQQHQRCRHQLHICFRAASTLSPMSPTNFSHLFVFFFFHGRFCLHLLPPTLHLHSQQHRSYRQSHHTPSSSSSSSPMIVCLGPPPATLHLHPQRHQRYRQHDHSTSSSFSSSSSTIVTAFARCNFPSTSSAATVLLPTLPPNFSLLFIFFFDDESNLFYHFYCWSTRPGDWGPPSPIH